MVIEEIVIKNFKSYGNNEQVLKLNTNKGELILLVGKNGKGKSSIIESIDYTLYNKVSGKHKKWVTLSNLPNRINGNLETSVKFKSSDDVIEVTRGQKPNKLILKENGIVNDRAGKKNIDSMIEKYVGLNIEAFKSFISMNINDFKNFINLSNAEKKLLLDKLFNLESINLLNDILKTVAKENKMDKMSLESQISTIEESISSIEKSIEKVKKKQEVEVDKDIQIVKEKALIKKGEYEDLKKKYDSLIKKAENLYSKMETKNNEKYQINSEIANLEKQIKLYEKGKCPTCASDLTTDEHLNIKDTLLEKKEKLKEVFDEINKGIQDFKLKENKMKEVKRKMESTLSDYKSELTSFKNELNRLNTKKDDNSNEDISEFVRTIETMVTKKEAKREELTTKSEKETYHKELNKILSENGVKKIIVQNILEPINYFIAENLKKMGMPHELVLDDTFTAKITLFGEEIDPETLSNGEDVRISVSILLSYIKLIRSKRNINVLFLDEVFSSIDVEGIDSILSLFKDFANEYKINVFLIHHAMLREEVFDRVLHIKKDVFSYIEEEKYD